MEFHPLIILYITTKITQKTTNFNGMSNPIQSILPSLSTCFYRLQHHTWLPGLRQQENNGGFPPIAVSPKRPGASVLPAHPKYKIPENWDSSSEFGSLGVSRFVRPGSPGAPVVHRLSTTTVDNLNGVWEF